MISLQKRRSQWGVPGDRLTIQQPKWGQKKMLEAVKLYEHQWQDEKTKKKSCFFSWEKYKAKLDNLSLSIHLVNGREKDVSFPFLSPGRWGTKRLHPTRHRAACSGHHSHIFGPFQKLRDTGSFLSASHSFYNEHHDFYHQEEKTIYIFKVWQGTPAFKMDTHLTAPPMRKSFEVIQ